MNFKEMSVPLSEAVVQQASEEIQRPKDQELLANDCQEELAGERADRDRPQFPHQRRKHREASRRIPFNNRAGASGARQANQ